MEQKVVMMNASINALMDVQREFEGVAEDMNIYNEQDVVKMVKEIRSERSENYQCE